MRRPKVFEEPISLLGLAKGSTDPRVQGSHDSSTTYAFFDLIPEEDFSFSVTQCTTTPFQEGMF